ncbi:kinase-like protein, partial [Trematosphaeria pertusa]
SNPWTWSTAPLKIDQSRIVPFFDPSSMTPALMQQHPTHYYVKQPNYLSHGTALFRGFAPVLTLSREIATCELLRAYPHPNICFYHGVQLDRYSRISGLVFDRYDTNLHEYVRQGHRFDAAACLADIEHGIDHMHRLGLVHCDVKPSNIFVDVANQRFVLGDFDSTHRRGQHIDMKWGTPGWSDERFVEAQREVDFYGLGMVRYWLQNKGWGVPEPGESYVRTKELFDGAE